MSGTERKDCDDEFGGVAHRRVEQRAQSLAQMRGQIFRRFAEHTGERDDCEPSKRKQQ